MNGAKLFGAIFSRLWLIGISLLLVVAIICLWRGFSPKPSNAEALAQNIQDPKFQTWYATIRTEQEKAAVRTALDTCFRKYGSSVWAKHAAEELGDKGEPRYFDLANLALSIDNGDDRLSFAKAHAETYSIIVQSGGAELAALYAEHLVSLRNKGGRGWQVAKSSPLAVVVYAAAESTGKIELWSWYLDNRDWVDDYLCSIQPDPDAVDDPGETIVVLLEEFRRRPKVYHAFRDEVMNNAKLESHKQGLEELTPSEFLAYSTGAIALYGDVFEVLCEANVPFGEALDVLSNNIRDLDFETPTACRKTGVELVNLYRSHQAVWNVAAEPGGNEAIKFFREVPQHADAVLTAFGEAGVLPFLMQNYSDSQELLVVAADVLVRYEATGWAVLAFFAGNGGNKEFKQALLHKDVGHLVVPYVVLKSENGEYSPAVSQCFENPGWVKRYLNPDGSFKPEEETIIEAMPFVGGIVTVAKHQVRGEPVTMGEIGWAVFDVVDDAVTIGALIAGSVASGGAATPALAAGAAAKTAAVQTAKAGTKLTIKQASKQLAKQSSKRFAKQSVKASGRYAAKQGGKVVLRNGIAASSKQEAKMLTHRTLLRRMAQNIGSVAPWTMRMGGKSLRVAASPVTKSVQTWRRLTPQARKAILRTAAAAMFFVAVTERTLPKLGPAIHETLKRTGQQIGNLVNETAKGAADFFTEAVAASFGISGFNYRWLDICIGIVFLIAALRLLLWRIKGSHMPVRIA